jgi:multiple antibiotic resistance protein
MHEQLLESLAMLFVTLNPISTAIYFAGASGGSDAPTRYRVAIKATLVALGILLVFAIGGDDLLQAVGIRLFSLKISGGILLFLFGVRMVMNPANNDAGVKSGGGNLNEQAVFPLAMPLMAGPASILTTVILIDRAGGDYAMQGAIMGILVLVQLISLLLMMVSGQVSRLLGRQGADILSRIMGLLLASLAVEMVLDGLTLARIIAA